ncbi:c-type cytochrome [Methylohalobius crimeensis]|uniref:c-type cytochrome n=1 Tax=Methylohalobius crimeensis TaxID=244365 RepID=UPI0004075A16|nr:c-type cytochrome [Methylohalobius crimeensis]
MQLDKTIAVFLGMLAGLSAHGHESSTAAMQEMEGDPQRGKVALQQYACTGCHVIPGVVGANSLVGPPLDRMAKRVYIAGSLPNTPENMIRWLRHPQEIASLSAMPDLGVNERDARDMAAYLYTLD